MKKICTKIIVCAMLALLAVSSISMYMPVDASLGIEPYSYYEQNFDFTGSCALARNCSGMFMDVKVRATASNNNNETITMEILIENRKITKSYTFLSDGQDHNYNNIFLGFGGGSGIRFTFTGANPAITIHTYLEVGSN